MAYDGFSLQIPTEPTDMSQPQQQDQQQNDAFTAQQFQYYQMQNVANQFGMQTQMPQQIYSRGVWTQQEDENLQKAVLQLGIKKWHEIARFVPTRTSKQCRERWFNCLDPNIKRSGFEPWEDQIIIEKQKEIGNKWSAIAKYLPGRSPGAIKNRWYSGLKCYHPSAAMASSLLGADQMQMMNPSMGDVL